MKSNIINIENLNNSKKEKLIFNTDWEILIADNDYKIYKKNFFTIHNGLIFNYIEPLCYLNCIKYIILKNN